jgi:hypothetical protein
MRFRFAVWLPVLFAALAVAGGCDASFDAYEDTDRVYSVFGYLDANADTQFVRVEPLQDSVFAGSDAFEARVTSENVATGETVRWNHRVFLTNPNNVQVHNFTTTADLDPEATYRFRVERERDGAASSAEVTTPSAFPRPTVENPPDRSERGGASRASGANRAVTELTVRGVETLGGVRAYYDYKSCNPVPPMGELACTRQQSVAFHLADTTRLTEEELAIEIPWFDDIAEQATGEILLELYTFRVIVAAAGADWPEYALDNPPGGGPQGQPLPPPGIGTNIEDGVGFLGGTFSYTVDVPILR